MGLRPTTDSMDGLCATNWSRNEGSRGGFGAGSHRRTLGSAAVFVLRAIRLHARQRVGTDLPAVQSQGGESSTSDATRHGGPVTRAGWVRDFGRASAGPVSARLLPSQIPSYCGAFRGIDGTGKRAGDGLVCGSSCCPLGISGADLEWPAGNGPARSTRGSTGQQRTSPRRESSSERRVEAISLREILFGAVVIGETSIGTN